MSSASLAVASRPHPDGIRISALSAAIALNLAALLWVTRPQAPIWTASAPDLLNPQVRLLDPPKPLPPPPPMPVLPKPHLAPAPVHLHTAPPVPAPTPPVVNEVTRQPTPVAPPTPPSIQPPASTAPPGIAPGVVSLAYRTAPLRFPAQALRQRLEGTVILLVLVDETGKPLQVQIAQTSGQPVLDRSAREQVLKSWLFQPAQADGHAIKAWAKVPVTFSIASM